MPFPRFTYREAMDRFGSDKPDVRFGMELHDLGEVVAGERLPRLRRHAAGGGRVLGIAAPGLASVSRRTSTS